MSPRIRACSPIVRFPVELIVPSTSASISSSFLNLTEPLIETPLDTRPPDSVGMDVRLDCAGAAGTSGWGFWVVNICIGWLLHVWLHVKLFLSNRPRPWTRHGQSQAPNASVILRRCSRGASAVRRRWRLRYFCGPALASRRLSISVRLWKERYEKHNTHTNMRPPFHHRSIRLPDPAQLYIRACRFRNYRALRRLAGLFVGRRDGGHAEMTTIGQKDFYEFICYPLLPRAAGPRWSCKTITSRQNWITLNGRLKRGFLLRPGFQRWGGLPLRSVCAFGPVFQWSGAIRDGTHALQAGYVMIAQPASNQSMKPRPQTNWPRAYLPRHPAAAYLFLVRRGSKFLTPVPNAHPQFFPNLEPRIKIHESHRFIG